MLLKKPKKLYVEWMDSTSVLQDTWVGEDGIKQLEEVNSTIKSSAILVAETFGTRGHIILATSCSPNGDYSTPMRIPKAAILKIKVLGVL